MSSTTFQVLYDAAPTTLTFGITSLGASATVGRESAQIDNSVTLYDDVLVFITFETGTVSGNKQVLLYAAGSFDGVTFTESAAGADAAFTRKDPTTLFPVAVIPAVTSATIHKVGPFSLAKVFGGVLPKYFNLEMFNDSGAAFSATAGSHVTKWLGVKVQGV